MVDPDVRSAEEDKWWDNELSHDIRQDADGDRSGVVSQSSPSDASA